MSSRRQTIALFGGVYSNHLALAQVLSECERDGVARRYCLGDLGAFGPHPDRVFPLLERHRVETLAGNYDDSLARGLDDCQCGYTDPRDNYFARLSYAYTFANTSDQNKSFLRALPTSIRLEVEGWRILLCHGSPRRQNEFLWESTSPDPFLEKLLDDHDADLIACTHTGLHWSRVLPSGRVFVNVGAIGRPANDGTPRVWYARVSLRSRAIEPVASRAIDVELVPVEYDHASLALEMRNEGLPEEFIATIETGWWTTCLEALPFRERKRGRF